MTELAITIPLAVTAGWALKSWLSRASEARADARLRRLLAPRVAAFRTGYARRAGGR